MRIQPIDQRDLKWTRVGTIAFRLYRFKGLRPMMIWLLRRAENDRFRSGARRKILLEYYNVYVGAYSYGSCLVPGQIHSGTVVGRYVSMGSNTKVYRKNHPHEWLSMHPFFYNPRLGNVDDDLPCSPNLTIGHDAWIGDNVTITPNCGRIGIGAVVGACSVVTRDVPDFAIVAGSPAIVRGNRFSEPVQKAVATSQWWELPAEALIARMDAMTVPFSDEHRPFLDSLADLRRSVRPKTEGSAG